MKKLISHPASYYQTQSNCGLDIAMTCLLSCLPTCQWRGVEWPALVSYLTLYTTRRLHNNLPTLTLNSLFTIALKSFHFFLNFLFSFWVPSAEWDWSGWLQLQETDFYFCLQNCYNSIRNSEKNIVVSLLWNFDTAKTFIFSQDGNPRKILL